MEAGELVDGGQLFMLAVTGLPNAPLADRQRQRATFQTVWVPIDDPDPDFPRLPDGTPMTTNDEAIHYVAGQGWAQGAAFFSRLEGAVYDDNVVYFCSTQGGGDPEDPDIATPGRPGTAKGPARSGPTTAAPAASSCSTRHPTATPSTSRTTSPPVRAAHW